MSNIRTISQLPAVKAENITEGSLFETSLHLKIKENNVTSRDAYVSRKLTKEDLEKLTTSASIKYLVDHNDLTPECKFDEMRKEIELIHHGDCVIEDGNDEKVFSGQKEFYEIPKIGMRDGIGYNDIDITNTSCDYMSINGKLLRLYVGNNFTPQINDEYAFGTLLKNDANHPSQLINSNKLGVTFTEDFHKVFENEFIFKIEPNSNVSNAWRAPTSGIFTCYGWIDEIKSHALNNSARWVALEAFNTHYKNWAILQLQPFISNNFCSYVSFSFPVKVGLMLRIRTGFPVGTNSDKYVNAQNTMTNHIANAFLGGVYTSEDVLRMTNFDDAIDAEGKSYVDQDTFNKALDEIDNKYIDNNELDDSLNNVKKDIHSDITNINNNITNINESLLSANTNITNINTQIKEYYYDNNAIEIIYPNPKLSINGVSLIRNANNININIGLKQISNNKEYLSIFTNNRSGDLDIIQIKNEKYYPCIPLYIPCVIVGKFDIPSYDGHEESTASWTANTFATISTNGKISIGYFKIHPIQLSKKTVEINDDFKTPLILKIDGEDTPVLCDNYIDRIRICGTYIAAN